MKAEKIWNEDSTIKVLNAIYNSCEHVDDHALRLPETLVAHLSLKSLCIYKKSRVNVLMYLMFTRARQIKD
jgi:hypothetical protein